MNKFLFSTAAIILLAISFSCKKKNIIEFDMPYTADIVLPVSSFTAGTTYSFTSQNIWTNIKDALAQHETNSNLIGEIKYTQFDIAVKTPTTGNLNFIDQIKFYILAENQPQLEVASKYDGGSDSIAYNAKSVSLNFTEENLKNRYIQPSVYYKIKILPHSVPPATTITITQNLHVKGLD